LPTPVVFFDAHAKLRRWIYQSKAIDLHSFGTLELMCKGFLLLTL
jgi:hypothetical protein